MNFRPIAVALAGCLIAGFAGAADIYPLRPIKLVVQFPPGGTTDIIARVVADGMSRELGQAVIVDNKAGAAGVIGSDFVAKAAPDGYTIGVATISTHAINPFVRQSPFDVEKDVAPVINMASVPNVMVVNPGVKAQNLKELIGVMKAEPGTFNFASAGGGTEGHVWMEAFNKFAGTKAVHVPYKGTAPAQTDTIGGATQIMVSNLPNLLPHIQAGKVRALAVTSPQRLPYLPNVPTYAEEGFPQLNRMSWFGLVVPAKTPPAIIERLNAAANKVLKSEAAQATFEKSGVVAQGGTAADFAKVMVAERALQGPVIKEANITVD